MYFIPEQRIRDSQILPAPPFQPSTILLLVNVKQLDQEDPPKQLNSFGSFS